jgi:hypothetical protein
MSENSESTEFAFNASSLNSTNVATQRWGMDLVGPLPTAQGNCRLAAVAVDYFTKWVEAKPLANIKATTIQKFFWTNIVCRFGVPRELIVDNGKQFDC